ncbi:uncharacterized protein LOC121386820 isoform X2 [Gigantopelta aegis]|uniref:uncharacterized protein LOC121386820 isoform X2 n=1 Tax=Gigantopelta aegis TaxID=1735272 RepID=UPI001B88BE55|nr:uncharacterized protein LOC121386820 isoform X2 [Gigantopelta aegis]
MYSVMWISLSVLFSCVFCINGVTFTLFNVKPVLKGKIIHLTCRVKQAEDLHATITFVRNSDSGNITMCSCQQTGANCMCDNSRHRGYRCTCMAKTNTAASVYKDYGITKYHTNDEDTEFWFCGSEDHGWSKSKVAVILKNPGLSVYPQPGVMMPPLTLVCTVVDQAFQHDVTFKCDSAEICACRAKTGRCVVHESSAEHYNCAHTYASVWRQTATYELKMKFFTASNSALCSCCSNYGENNCSNVVELQPNPTTDKTVSGKSVSPTNPDTPISTKRTTIPTTQQQKHEEASSTTDKNVWEKAVSHVNHYNPVSAQRTSIPTTQKTKREDDKSGSGSAYDSKSNQLFSLTLPGVVGVLVYRLNL